jgi:hypothetical protein
MSGPTPISLSGYVSGGGGTLPILGVGSPEITGNANLTLTLAQADPFELLITSDGASTAMRKVIVPLIAGKTWLIHNGTSDGYPIQVIGATGTGVIVANGAAAVLATDGTNVFTTQPAFGGLTVTFQPGGLASGTVFTNWVTLRKYVQAVFALAGSQLPIAYVIDTTFGSASVPANDVIPGTQITIQAATAGVAFTALGISDGVTFSDINTGQQGTLNVIGMSIGDNSTTSLVTLSFGAIVLNFVDSTWVCELSSVHSGGAFSVTGGSSVSLLASGTAEFANNASSTKAFVLLDTGNSSSISGSLMNAFVTQYALQGGDAGSITLSASQSLIATHANAAAFAIAVTADCTLSIGSGPSWHSLQYSDAASLLGYTAGTASNWTNPPISAGSAPTQAANALDLIASAIHAGGGGAVTALTGDVAASGPGTAAATVQAISGTGGTGGSIEVGNGHSATLYTLGGSSNFGLAAGGSLQLFTNSGSPSMQLTQANTDFLALGGALSGGAVTAGGGLFRVPSSPGVPVLMCRNPTNTGDVNCLEVYNSGSNQYLSLGASGITQFLLNVGLAGWYTLAGQGTTASQDRRQFDDTGYVTVAASSTNTVIYSFTPPSGYSGIYNFTVVARATTAPSGGSIGDTWTQVGVTAFKSPGGSTTAIGSATTLSTITDTSLSGHVSVGLVSGSGINIAINNSSTASLDCKILMSPLVYC